MGRRISAGLDATPEQIIAKITKRIAEMWDVQSAAETLATFPPEEAAVWLGGLSEDERMKLEYSWEFWARPKQRVPAGNWKRLLWRCGRGFGKTRSGAEWVRDQIEKGLCRHIAIVAANAGDLRDVMIEQQRGGGAGLLQICPPWNRPHYSPTKMKLTWDNPEYKSYGASCSLYSAEAFDKLRGPAHDAAWLDEFAKFPKADEVLEQLEYGMRIGDQPKIVITTTPRPTPAFMKLHRMAAELADPASKNYEPDPLKRHTIEIVGSTFENQANLSPNFFKDMMDQHEGTRSGKQELFADLLLDVEGALWTTRLIEQAYLPKDSELPVLRTKVVGVDPQMSKIEGALTGIVVCGSAPALRGNPVRGYVLADRSVNGTPREWARAAIDAYWDYQCQLMIVERNQGGEGVEATIHNLDPNVRVKLVTATKSKGERAVPVVSRYEQGRVFHLGSFHDLEQEMLTFCPGDEHKKKSPNRVDALVYGLDYLLVAGLKAGAGFVITKVI